MTHLAAGLFSLLLLVVGLPDGWLGIYLDPNSDAPRVLEVVPDSPAASAGLRTGDLIVAVDATATTTRDAFVETIRGCQQGQRVRLRITRDGKEVQVMVLLGERPQEAGTPPANPGAGQRPGRPATPAAPAQGEAATPLAPRRPQDPAAKPSGRGYLGAAIGEGDDGLEVQRVIEGSPAAKAGLAAGDLLRRWGKREIDELEQLEQLVGASKPGDVVELEVERGDATKTLTVTLGVRPDGAAVAPAPATTTAPAAVELPFHTDFDAAMAAATAAKRPLLVVYGAAWDGASQAQRRALASPELQPLLAKFVGCYLDGEQHRAQFAARKVGELPQLEVWRDGEVATVHAGFLPADELRAWLERGLAAPKAEGGAPAPGESADVAPPAGGGEPSATDAAVRAELKELRRELEELRRLLEDLRKARSGGE